MVRAESENRYIIRKFIRALSVSKNINAYKQYADVDQAIKFFIILHNVLLLEDKYYDIVIMSKREVNKYLHLERSWRVDDILGEFYKLYNRGSTIRSHIETIERIEEVRLALKKNKDIYQKLVLKL
jgi:hypothetical protein